MPYDSSSINVGRAEVLAFAESKPASEAYVFSDGRGGWRNCAFNQARHAFGLDPVCFIEDFTLSCVLGETPRTFGALAERLRLCR